MSNAIQHPKVVVIGSGSLFFGRQAIWQMVHSEHLNKGTLGLVDTDPERNEKMAKLAEMVIAENNVELKLEASTDRREVLKDADFVVLSFADRSVKFRGIDCEVSLEHNVRMCSGDTIGPGGIFRALREFPVILDCVEDIKELCPDAWVINYINPTAVHGMGLARYAPEVKSFALCDGLHMPNVKKWNAVRAGIVEDGKDYTDEIDAKFDMRIAGVNHFTWLLWATYEGKDVTPKIAECSLGTRIAAVSLFGRVLSQMFAPYRDACRRAGVKCALAGIKAPPVAPRVRFLVERTKGGIKVAIKGRPDTEEVITDRVLKKSVGKAAKAYCEKHLGSIASQGAKHAGLGNRFRAVLRAT